MSAEIKNEIVAAIAKTNDENMKVVLMLMLAVFDDIGNKIDAISKNEKGLRDTVLNGHADVHHTHHEWVSAKIREEEEDAKADKDSKRKIRDDLITKILWVLLAAACGSAGYLLK